MVFRLLTSQMVNSFNDSQSVCSQSTSSSSDTGASDAKSQGARTVGSQFPSSYSISNPKMVNGTSTPASSTSTSTNLQFNSSSRMPYYYGGQSLTGVNAPAPPSYYPKYGTGSYNVSPTIFGMASTVNSPPYLSFPRRGSSMQPAYSPYPENNYTLSNMPVNTASSYGEKQHSSAAPGMLTPKSMQLPTSSSSSSERYLPHPKSEGIRNWNEKKMYYDMNTHTYEIMTVGEALDGIQSGTLISSKEKPTEPNLEPPKPKKNRKGKIIRSRAGCLTCRQRKKRCTETKPVCAECKRLSIRCRWPVPGTERKNRTKKNPYQKDVIQHQVYGMIKVLRGVIDYKVEK